ncbi:unnamed protein product [Musa banksii]
MGSSNLEVRVVELSMGFCCCLCRRGKDGREGVVLLLPEGQEVPNRSWVLEGHRKRQGGLQGERSPRWHEEDPCVLRRKGTQGSEDKLGDARKSLKQIIRFSYGTSNFEVQTLIYSLNRTRQTNTSAAERNNNSSANQEALQGGAALQQVDGLSLAGHRAEC